MSWLDAQAFYQSEDTPKFKIGDKVFKITNEYDEELNQNIKICYEFIVESISSEKKGFLFKEFIYTIKNIKNNKIETDVYESELFTEYKHIKKPKKKKSFWETLADAMDLE